MPTCAVHVCVSHRKLTKATTSAECYGLTSELLLDFKSGKRVLMDMATVAWWEFTVATQ